MPSEDEDESSKISDNKVTLYQTSAAETVTLAAAGDDAVTADDSLARADKSEESVEAIKAHLSSTMGISIHNLSDESNPLSNHVTHVASSLQNTSVINSSLENIDDPNLSDEESDDADESVSEVDSSTERKAEKLGSFVESFLKVENTKIEPSKKDSGPNKSKVTPVKKKAENIPFKKTPDKKSFTPRKPRRVALIS